MRACVVEVDVSAQAFPSDRYAVVGDCPEFCVSISVGCAPYFFDSSANVISSRIAPSATLALKSREWFFRFVILDRHSDKSIHLKRRSESLRPPL